jgi:hypothetical protein
MRRTGWDVLSWSGGPTSLRAAFLGALQGALLCAAAHAALAAAAVLGKAAFSVAAPPSADEFLQAVTVVALSSTGCALVFGAPLLMVLGRLGAGGLLTYALCGALGGAAAGAFSSWTWPPFEAGLTAFLAWYGAAAAAAVWWRARALRRD